MDREGARALFAAGPSGDTLYSFLPVVFDGEYKVRGRARRNSIAMTRFQVTERLACAHYIAGKGPVSLLPRDHATASSVLSLAIAEGVLGASGGRGVARGWYL